MKETNVCLSVKTNSLTGENDYKCPKSINNYIIIDLIISRWDVYHLYVTSIAQSENNSVDQSNALNTELPCLGKSALWSSRTGRFSVWASNISFAVAQWARDQASRLPTKSLNEQTKTCPGQALFEKYLQILRASWNSSFFSSPDYMYSWWVTMHIHVGHYFFLFSLDQQTNRGRITGITHLMYCSVLCILASMWSLHTYICIVHNF